MKLAPSHQVKDDVKEDSGSLKKRALPPDGLQTAAASHRGASPCSYPPNLLHGEKSRWLLGSQRPGEWFFLVSPLQQGRQPAKGGSIWIPTTVKLKTFPPLREASGPATRADVHGQARPLRQCVPGLLMQVRKKHCLSHSCVTAERMDGEGRNPQAPDTKPQANTNTVTGKHGLLVGRAHQWESKYPLSEVLTSNGCERHIRRGVQRRHHSEAE